MAKSRAKSSNDFEIKSTEDVFLDFATPKIESLFDSIYKTFENKQSSKITKSVLLPINNFFEKFAKKEAQKRLDDIESSEEVESLMQDMRKRAMDRHYKKLDKKDQRELETLQIKRKELDAQLKQAQRAKDNSKVANIQTEISKNEASQNAIKRKVMDYVERELKYSGEYQAYTHYMQDNTNGYKSDFDNFKNTPRKQTQSLVSQSDKSQSVSEMWQKDLSELVGQNKKDADDEYVERAQQQREERQAEQIQTQRFETQTQIGNEIKEELSAQTALLKAISDKDFSVSSENQDGVIDSLLDFGGNALKKGGGILSKVGSVASKVAMPLMIAKAGYDAFQAGSDDEAILAQSGKQDASEISWWDRTKHGLAGAVEGLSFGLLDKNTLLDGGEGLVNFISGDGFKSNRELALETNAMQDTQDLSAHEQLLVKQAEVLGNEKPQFERDLELADLSEDVLSFSSINAPSVINNNSTTITQNPPRYRIIDQSTNALSSQGI